MFFPTFACTCIESADACHTLHHALSLFADCKPPCCYTWWLGRCHWLLHASIWSPCMGSMLCRQACQLVQEGAEVIPGQSNMAIKGSASCTLPMHLPEAASVPFLLPDHPSQDPSDLIGPDEPRQLTHIGEPHRQGPEGSEMILGQSNAAVHCGSSTLPLPLSEAASGTLLLGRSSCNSVPSAIPVITLPPCIRRVEASTAHSNAAASVAYVNGKRAD